MSTKTYVDSCIIHLHTLHGNEWQLRMHFIMDHWFTITVCFHSFWPNNIKIVHVFLDIFNECFYIFALKFVGFLLWANNIFVQTVHCIWQQFRAQCKVNNAGKADTILMGKGHTVVTFYHGWTEISGFFTTADMYCSTFRFLAKVMDTFFRDEIPILLIYLVFRRTALRRFTRPLTCRYSFPWKKQ